MISSTVPLADQTHFNIESSQFLKVCIRPVLNRIPGYFRTFGRNVFLRGGSGVGPQAAGEDVRRGGRPEPGPRPPQVPRQARHQPTDPHQHQVNPAHLDWQARYQPS